MHHCTKVLAMNPRHFQVEELDMLARLQLAREREEDSMDNLVDAGEEEEEGEGEEEEERVEEDEDTESLSRCNAMHWCLFQFVSFCVSRV